MPWHVGQASIPLPMQEAHKTRPMLPQVSQPSPAQE